MKLLPRTTEDAREILDAYDTGSEAVRLELERQIRRIAIASTRGNLAAREALRLLVLERRRRWSVPLS